MASGVTRASTAGVVVFPESDVERLAQEPLYQAKHRLQSGTQRLSVRVSRKPGAAGVDPFHLMIDRTPSNNIVSVQVADEN